MHDESGSAGTLFVEPTEAIELGNALREAEVEEERETLEVLRELTDLLRPELPALRERVEMCVAVDDLVARARYAVAVAGEVPEVGPRRTSSFAYGRHPLLLGGRERSFRSTSRWSRGANGADQRAQHRRQDRAAQGGGARRRADPGGIVPPVGAGADFRCSPASLPTSAIASPSPRASPPSAPTSAILRGSWTSRRRHAGAAGRGGERDRSGRRSALAGARSRSLTARGALTLATTHLGALKDWRPTPGVVNASLQFDAATLTPTYRFVKGVPGRSYGLAIARRLGVEPEILTDAEARVPDAERNLDASWPRWRSAGEMQGGDAGAAGAAVSRAGRLQAG